MKRACLLLPALLLAPLLAQAGNWAKVERQKDSIVLLDQASIGQVDGGRKAWTLESWRKPQNTPDGKAYLSLKSQHLYACEERSRTLLAQSYFGEVLGRGEPLASYKYEAYDAETIEPGSAQERILAAVCRPQRRSSKAR